MSRYLAAVISFAALTLAAVFPADGQQPESCQIGRAVIIAVNSARTGSDVTIPSGDVIVNQAPSGPTLGNGFSLYIDRRSSIPDTVKAHSIRIFQQATVGTAFYNQLTNDGTIGFPNTPLTLPVFNTLPPFNEATFRGTPANVSVAAGETRVLDAGEYGNITIAAFGRLVFTGGTYHVLSIDAIADDTFLTFNAPSEVRLTGKFRTRRRAAIGPAAGSGFTAGDVRFYVAGINGNDGQLNSTPEAARFGSSSTVNANFYVPNGTLRAETDVVATGAFIGRDVQVDSRAQVSRQSAFSNLAPVANAQDVVTNGSEPLVITLTASDPEGGDMTFAIVAGLQFPSRGTLGAVGQDPPPFPGNPPGCNPDTTPGCIPPGPARTSATVTYTPTTAGNEENSFTFSATDACGNTGMAVVRINPAGDQTQPPVQQVVDATDVVVETAIETPRSITLVAGAPPGATLTFSVETLPAHGALQDESGTAIEAVPYTLPSRKVTYTPATGFTGLDTFNFRATGSVGGSDTASVLVNVVALAQLAQDQTATTNINTPVEITLLGNPGGGGTFAAADVVPSIKETQTLTLLGAVVAGNVSDADGDGLGDGRDDLPGPAPVLVAAGVDVNLGSPASATVGDPDNDATPSSNDDPDPDLVTATVVSNGPNITFAVRFKPGTFDPQLTRAQFVLDTDRNPATGHPGSDAGCSNDNGIIGAEFLVNLGANLGTTAQVLGYQGTCNSFASVGSGTTTFVTDGMDATVPRSVLGNTDGRLNFKVVTSEQLAPGPGFTGVLDYMPNVGLSPGQLLAGVQGVARIQIEWNVSSLPGAADIDTAQVTLRTLKGTVDSLDTFFFVGTQEQEGLLRVTDFQAPAASIAGVVMPVPVGAPTGTEGTFAFDVTQELRAARTAGRNFFSIQGRVNETLAGGGFKRGLQVRSTATGNLVGGLEPKLTVGAAVGPELSFTITSLPTNGTLTFQGAPVLVNDTFTTPPTLLYSPNFNFSGTDTFAFRVTEGALVDLATVTISVAFDNCVFNGRDPGCSP